ncbi:MAG: L-histidine N(alpha)-methyltransferase [Azospirillum sp.]|nr:L-histidine N(alpha)-methyltransferase [Azospirillum sp.]
MDDQSGAGSSHLWIEPGHDIAQFRAAVVAGLARADKALPCKYFYDEIGSRLFEQICTLAEYYPTRTELAILDDRAEDIAAAVAGTVSVIEFGSGAGHKVRRILDHLAGVQAYLPVDISREALLAAAARLDDDYPRLAVMPVWADFTKPFALPDGLPPGPRLGFFPGSTIGNFSPAEASEFLAASRAVLGAGGHFLVGVDLVKDARVLEAAYDDALGVTARFNLNLLARINRELHGGFDLGRFRHVARYDRADQCVRMWLESLVEQTVRIGETAFRFRRGERIHTENSYKYTIENFQVVAAQAGWHPTACWTDPARLFSIHLLG